MNPAGIARPARHQAGAQRRVSRKRRTPAASFFSSDPPPPPDERHLLNGKTHKHVDQHGIFVIPGSKEFVSTVVSMNNMPGLSRNIRWLELSQVWMKGLELGADAALGVKSSDYYDATTAHELGHTVNI